MRILLINGKQYAIYEPVVDDEGTKHYILYPYVPVTEMRTESK